MGAESAFERALYGAITGATSVTSLLPSASGVYSNIAPDTAAFPVVIYNQQAGVMENIDSHRRENLLYAVKAVSDRNMGQAGSIDEALDAKLDGTSLSVTGYTRLWLRREQSVRYVEADEAGKRYFHAGGVYRVWLGEV